MSSDTLHFLSEAKLAQTANFIETGLASLARLQASAPRGALDAALLAEFADMAEKAGALRRLFLWALPGRRRRQRPRSLRQTSNCARVCALGG